MRFVTHIIAADVRRHWPVLAAWLLLVAGTTVLDGVHPRLAADAGSVRSLTILAELLWLTKLLLAFIVVPAIVQTHTLVGSDAFWMTRPIPPRALLVSKALLIALVMILAPVLAEAALMVAYDVPSGRLSAVAAESALWQTFWVVLLTVLAVLTRNLAGFALLTGATLMAFVAVLAMTMALLMARLEDDLPGGYAGATPDDPTGGLIWMLLVVASGGALAVAQYHTRSRLRAVGVGVAGVLLAFGAAAYWPWPILVHQLELPSWAASASALRLHADAGTVGTVDQSHRRWREWETLAALVRVEGIEPGWSATVALREAAVRLPDSTNVVSPFSNHPSPVPSEWDDVRPNDGVLARLLSVERIVSPTPPEPQRVPVFFVRSPGDESAELKRGTYRGRFEVRLVRQHLETVLPLKPGAAHAGPAYSLTIHDIEQRPERLVVLADEMRATSMFDRRPRADYTVYLRNQRAGEAIRGFNGGYLESSLLSRVLPFGMAAGGTGTGFAATPQAIEFTTRSDGAWSVRLDDEWLRGADLVVLRTTHEGFVERTLQIPGFPVPRPDIDRHAARNPPPGALQASCDVQLGQRVALMGIVDAQ